MWAFEHIGFNLFVKLHEFSDILKNSLPLVDDKITFLTQIYDYAKTYAGQTLDFDQMIFVINKLRCKLLNESLIEEMYNISFWKASNTEPKTPGFFEVDPQHIIMKSILQKYLDKDMDYFLTYSKKSEFNHCRKVHALLDEMKHSNLEIEYICTTLHNIDKVDADDVLHDIKQFITKVYGIEPQKNSSREHFALM